MSKGHSETGNRAKMELSFNELYDGYTKSIETAWELFSAGQKLSKQHSSISLGLFQLGQEEVGRSFSFLDAFNFEPEDERWKRLFSNEEWRGHQLKAHRAFFYEVLCPMRITTFSRSRNVWFDGGPIRNKISDEKEAALYLNYDKQKRKFLSPMENVDYEEVANRGMTLLYLCTTANYVKTGLDLDAGETKEMNYRLFSDIPSRIVTQMTYQQDFPEIFREFRERSQTHGLIASNLEMSLNEGKEFLKSITKKKMEEPR